MTAGTSTYKLLAVTFQAKFVTTQYTYLEIVIKEVYKHNRSTEYKEGMAMSDPILYSPLHKIPLW
jgi:hypothetical protein